MAARLDTAITFTRAMVRAQLVAAHQAGRRAKPLLPIDWERRWDEAIDELQTRLRVQPLAPAA